MLINWNTNAGENYVSNGPFKMTAWKHSGSITLEKNDPLCFQAVILNGPFDT
jgi:ABC-type transport system substrate-binding protein